MINVSAVPPSDSLLGNYSSITLSESGRLGVGSYLEYREVRPGVYLNLLDLDTELWLHYRLQTNIYNLQFTVDC